MEYVVVLGGYVLRGCIDLYSSFLFGVCRGSRFFLGMGVFFGFGGAGLVWFWFILVFW